MPASCCFGNSLRKLGVGRFTAFWLLFSASYRVAFLGHCMRLGENWKYMLLAVLSPPVQYSVFTVDIAHIHSREDCKYLGKMRRIVLNSSVFFFILGFLRVLIKNRTPPHGINKRARSAVRACPKPYWVGRGKPEWLLRLINQTFKIL